MDSPFVHIVFTKYNIRGISTQFIKDKKGNPPLTDDWYNERFYLFNTYCLPSIINQSSKDFHWIILVDKFTPKNHLDKIISSTDPYKNIEFIKVEDVTEMINQVNKSCLKLLEKNNKNYLITTRLDNDDMLHQNMIEFVQFKFNYQESLLINLQSGFTYDLRTGVLFNSKSKFSPFLSLIETVKDGSFETVFIGSHMKIKGRNLLNISDKRLWCQVIHKRNLVNIHRGSILWNIDPLSKFISINKYPSRIAILREWFKSALFTRPRFLIRNFLIYCIAKIK